MTLRQIKIIQILNTVSYSFLFLVFKIKLDQNNKFSDSDPNIKIVCEIRIHIRIIFAGIYHYSYIIHCAFSLDLS